VIAPRRHTGPGALVLILAAALAAPWLTPFPPEQQEDPAGARFLPPLSRAHALRLEPHRVRIVTGLRRVADGWQYDRAGSRLRVAGGDLLEPPEPRFYVLGTDALGRDLASRLLHGLRHSVVLAGLATGLALFLGTLLGAGAAMGGRRWDALLTGGADAFRAVPRVLVYLLCAALFAPSTLLLVAVLGGTTWTGVSRLVRARVLALRRSDLVLAAQAAGAAPARQLFVHLLPQLGPLLVASAALRFADTVLLESALALLGLGSPPPAVSLGDILASGRESFGQAWWVTLWPGLLIAGIVLTLRSATADLFRSPDPASLR
jgi:peptide/nickel transport system permease protein